MKTFHFTFIILLFTSALFAQTNNQGTPEINLRISAKPIQKLDSFIVELEIKNVSGKTIRMIDSFNEPDGRRRFFMYSFSYGLHHLTGGGIVDRAKDKNTYKTFKPGETLRLKLNVSKWIGTDFPWANEEVMFAITYYSKDIYNKNSGEDYVKGNFESNTITVRLEK